MTEERFKELTGEIEKYGFTSKATGEELLAEVRRLREDAAIADKIIESRNEVLRVLECPVHGECVPGALEQIKDMREQNEKLRAENNRIAGDANRQYDEWLKFRLLLREAREFILMENYEKEDYVRAEQLDATIDQALGEK